MSGLTFEERLAALEGNVDTVSKIIDIHGKTIREMQDIQTIMGNTQKDLLQICRCLSERIPK
jgi:hypothetical protein